MRHGCQQAALPPQHHGPQVVRATRERVARQRVEHEPGPGFDLAGNQADNGAGKHFGDPSVTFGFDVTYLPWNLTFDLGTAVSQYLLEPKIHEGVDHDLLLTVRWGGWSHD